MRQLYQSAEWRALRKDVLFTVPLCVTCSAAGRVTVATDVDHIIPHRGDRELFFDIKNLQPLCKSCHSRKTRRGG